MKLKKSVIKKSVPKKTTFEKVVNPIVNPIRHEFSAKDLLQVIIGATILAIPVGFTQEVWEIGVSISNTITGIFVVLSVLFISTFAYYHYHRHRTPEQKGHKIAFIKRVFFTYLGSLVLVTILLKLITTSDISWAVVNIEELIRIIVIVTLPASMSASIADTLK